MTDLLTEQVRDVEPRVIAWRREIHQNPELGNREFRTASLVSGHLQSLGLKVRTGVAHTGVVATLGQGKPLVALRADMDALPITEAVQVPFASKVRTTWNGQEVGVMHACGHDAHVAILMGVAQLLTEMRASLHGSVRFIFQPAEEGAPPGERGGAELMVEEGVLDGVSAIFGLHVTSRLESGTLGCRPGAQLASTDGLRIVVRGRQTHGAYPWLGVDPIVIASQIVLALQTIPSRQLNVTVAPAVITIGKIHGGVRNNIIPESVEMIGTVRALDEEMRRNIHERVERTARLIAESSGGSAEVEITRGYPVTFNDPVLTARMAPTLRRVAGPERLIEIPPVLGGEDFSFYQKKVPGLFFYVGVRPRGTAAADAAPNHSAEFFVDESGLAPGIRALAGVAVDFLQQSKQ